jgi:hypothetical protein
LSGLESIGPADLTAWQQLAGVRLTPWETSLILRLDALRRAPSEK